VVAAPGLQEAGLRAHERPKERRTSDRRTAFALHHSWDRDVSTVHHDTPVAISDRTMLVKAPLERSAVFLDIDGTLLDIAPTPQTVRVPAGLIDSLTRLHRALGGALAFVSGRRLDDIDALFAPLRMVAAAEHGAILRLPGGRVEETDIAIPAEWRTDLARFARAHPGVLIEEKKHSIVAHYRLAPAAEPAARRIADALAAGEADRFHVLPARMAYEICSREVSKAAVMRRLMTIAPFSGRLPVFVGDDVSDEPAIAAAKQAGGLGLHVARDFGGEPARVRAWVSALADRGRPAQSRTDGARAG
jgi:trehalose 6-phosphate phosphatase